jgi:ATPase subunit of ABC transporter with duplicated ATPase domains
MTGNLKAMKAEKSQGKQLQDIQQARQDLSDQLAQLRLPEVLTPRFSLDTSASSDRTWVQIFDGQVGYDPDQTVLSGINLTVSSQARVAIAGDNGSGKSTLFKAILGDETIHRAGDWRVPKRPDIGYLDQHYGTLDPGQSVLEALSKVAPGWSHAEIRRYLNDFLFRKNEEVNARVSTLSGGEKARLSLAQIAAKTPKLLLLDEITNNLDLQAQQHVAQVLKTYPGALIVISHDAEFLKEIEINQVYYLGVF